MIPYLILVRRPSINKIFTPNGTAFNSSLKAKVDMKVLPICFLVLEVFNAYIFLCVNKKKYKIKYTQVVSYLTSGITGDFNCILTNSKHFSSFPISMQYFYNQKNNYTDAYAFLLGKSWHGDN